MKKLICIILCLLLMAGCGQDPSGDTPELPAHIYREVSEGLLIDAEVTGWPEDGVLTLWEVRTPEFTEEQIETALAAIGDARIPDSYSSSSMDDIWDCTSGGVAVVNKATDYIPPSFFYRNWAVEKQASASPYSRFPLLCSPKALESDIENTLNHMFCEPRDVSVCTEAEAMEQVRQVLENFGISDLVFDYTLYFDLESLRQADEIVCGPWGLEHAKLCMYEDKTFGPWLPFDWAESYEGYFFHFSFTADGYSLGYKAPSDNYIVSEGTAWINGTGIWQMGIQAPFQKGEKLETQETPISPEDALELVIEEYGERLVSFQRTVSKIALDYRCEIIDGRWQLRPMWVISIDEPAHDYYLEPLTVEYAVDAFTGKKI